MASVNPEKTRWMRGPSTPLRGALLGLLLERPGHGGDLANRLAARLGETWRVDTNDVYRLLEQLEKTGLAASRAEPKRNNHRRTHLVYHPTEETSGALTLWMETLLPREPVRLGLQAKLSVAREQDAQRLLEALKAYERECLLLAHLVSPTDGAGPLVDGAVHGVHPRRGLRAAAGRGRLGCAHPAADQRIPGTQLLA